MRIAFLTYGSIEQVSGGFIYDRALLNALAARGHQIDVVSLPWRAYPAAVVAGVLKTRGRRGGGDHDDNDDGTSRHDVVIEDELCHPSLFARPAAASRRRARPPRIALVHNLRSAQPRESARRLKAGIERRYLATVDGAIAVCAATRDDVDTLATTPLPALVAHPGRDHVRPAIDDATIAARAAEGGPLRVLHVAAVSPHKGLARLLASLFRAARDGGLDFSLDVVGAAPRGAYARKIARAIAASGIAPRVRQHGELRGDALLSVFRRSQVFALPSDREAYSLACLEALGFGLPVLATSSGGLSEMITGGREGFLIAPDDTVTWAARLSDLGADRARLATMSHGAHERYAAHATWAQVAARVEEFLEARVEAKR